MVGQDRLSELWAAAARDLHRAEARQWSAFVWPEGAVAARFRVVRRDPSCPGIPSVARATIGDVLSPAPAILYATMAMTTTARWTFSPEAREQLTQLLVAEPCPEEWFRLRRMAEELALTPGFERLIALDQNRIRELPHQIEVAMRVLRPPMRGRAVLADEVGLGKTIEAGLIYKELAVRGLARRVLVLAPSSLVGQWQAELETKFLEKFATPTSAGEWKRATRGIISYNRALAKKHREQILKHHWDLVIVDEAHKVKNHTSKRYQFVRDLDKNFLLLLTATPLQNNLRELYNLITLLRPGQLGTWSDFSRRFLVRGDPRRAKDPDALRELNASVMVRTRRSSVAHEISLPPRIPSHPGIVQSKAEAELYDLTVGFVRQLYREGFVPDDGDRGLRRRRTGKGVYFLELMRLCQRLTSSSHALATSMRKLAEGDLVTPEYRRHARAIADHAESVETHCKLDALERIMREHDDQLIVFSEHLPTLKLIRQRVHDTGRPAIVFQGGLSLSQRIERLARFQSEPRGVFVATRSGTEGLNLQFCNRLVNYELPWNPMVVEQRIGRIHRIGQTREAHIVNFAAAGTIESHILRILDEKIQLFRLVVGELDVILGQYGDGEKLEKSIGEAFLGAASDEEFERFVSRLGVEIEQSREEGFRQEQAASQIAPNDNAARLEQEFHLLTHAGRIRLGYGTDKVSFAAGVDTVRRQLGLQPHHILEALEHAAPAEDAGNSEYGRLVRITGITGAVRTVVITASADRLPIVITGIEADG
jgi:superfamily II DNA or RNA helicase